MADYNGSDNDDIIDVSELASDVINIYPGNGNDIIINATSQHNIVASPGEDSISGKNTSYALWQSRQNSTVNLKEGWADDGFGYRDALSGVTTVHGSSNGHTIYGSEANERFFANGGDNFFEGGGGADRISYAGGNSKDYKITKVGDEFHIEKLNGFIKTLDKVKNVRFIEFMEDNKLIDTNYEDAILKAENIKIIYSFSDNTMAPEYTYAGVTTPAKLVSWFAQGGQLLDINEDGIKDAIIPMSKGYGSGVDGSTPFIALTSNQGTLIFDEQINEKMPVITSSRRAEIIELANSPTLSIISVHHDTHEESKRSDPDRTVPRSELTIINTKSVNTTLEEIVPKLPYGTDEQPYAVDAHSMAVGDINGDGLSDILVGDWGNKPFVLVQKNDGSFEIIQNEFYSFVANLPSNNPKKYNLLIDLGLTDINNDGFEDIIAGYGHGDTSSKIFLNNSGEFNKDIYIDIPDSIYGSDNQLHMKTMTADFDYDGDEDIAIQWSRNEPYYGGHYIQILLNDGKGNLTDTTDTIPLRSLEDAYLERLQWSEPWQMLDINNDNHIDIIGTRATNKNPIIYINDGSARFEIDEILQNVSLGSPYIFSDFDNDRKLEYITVEANVNAANTETKISFHLYELTSEIGTGPSYSTDTAEKGAPGFNEQYYLNENSSAKEAVDAGTYATGLEHYLAEGKDAELKTFAPFTKVHGYSGDDTIILREGNETAFGYAGKDTFEGGAGNDIIDGGAGVDTAFYKDSSSAYVLTTNDDGTVSVVHSSPSEGFADEGSDTLTSIEKMQFSDKTLSKTSLKYQLSETVDASKNILSAHTEDVLSGTLNFNKGDNIIILDGQGKTYRGLEGDDTYFVSQLLPKSGKVSITDTEGSNTIQLPSNTYVDKSLFTKNAARLTLENEREITISGADKFSYNVGGNITDGTKGTDLTFTEFAEVFGVYDILNSSGSQNGTITDMYII